MSQDVPPALQWLGLAAVMLACLAYIGLPLLRADGRSVHDLPARSRVANSVSG